MQILYSKWSRIGSWIFYPDYFLKPKKSLSSWRAFTFVKKTTSKNNLTKDDSSFFMSTKQGFGQFFYASPLSFFLLVLESWVLVLLRAYTTRILVVVHFMTCNKYFCPSSQAFVSSQGTWKHCCSSDIKKPFELPSQESL